MHRPCPRPPAAGAASATPSQRLQTRPRLEAAPLRKGFGIQSQRGQCTMMQSRRVCRRQRRRGCPSGGGDALAAGGDALAAPEQRGAGSPVPRRCANDGPQHVVRQRVDVHLLGFKHSERGHRALVLPAIKACKYCEENGRWSAGALHRPLATAAPRRCAAGQMWNTASSASCAGLSLALLHGAAGMDSSACICRARQGPFMCIGLAASRGSGLFDTTHGHVHAKQQRHKEERQPAIESVS